MPINTYDPRDLEEPPEEGDGSSYCDDDCEPEEPDVCDSDISDAEDAYYNHLTK